MWGLGVLVFAAVIDPGKLQDTIGSTNYPLFLLIGVAFQAYTGASIYGAWEIHDELTKGQIEYTIASPVSRYSYIFSHSLSQAIIGTIFSLLPMFAIAALFMGLPSPWAMAMASISVILTFLALYQIGVMISSTLLVLKNVSAIMSIFNFLQQIVTGMLVPVQFLPEPMKVLAFVIPFTHGMDLARRGGARSACRPPDSLERIGEIVDIIP